MTHNPDFLKQAHRLNTVALQQNDVVSVGRHRADNEDMDLYRFVNAAQGPIEVVASITKRPGSPIPAVCVNIGRAREYVLSWVMSPEDLNNLVMLLSQAQALLNTAQGGTTQ